MSVEEEFCALFPICSNRFSLELPTGRVDEHTGEVRKQVWENGEGYLQATVYSLSWVVDGENRRIGDVKEQDVFFLNTQYREHPRLSAFFAGWAAAVQYVLDRHSELAEPGEIECLMPFDFFAGEALLLRRPQTAEDFTHVLLSSKKYLGKLLP